MIKNIFEEIEKPFAESNVKESSNLIERVCLFGSAKSLNGRIYSEQALNDITNLANGNKAFLDHPSKQDAKNRDGVRSVKDWLGSFSNPLRQGDKIMANLTVRKEFMPLMKDIAEQSPVGVGFSINARAMVGGKDEQGNEKIEGIKTLNSTDLVMSAATTSSLFEQLREVNNKPMTEKEIKEMADKYLGKNPEDLDARAIQKFLSIMGRK